jgi:hypothetical protein
MRLSFQPRKGCAGISKFANFVIRPINNVCQVAKGIHHPPQRRRQIVNEREKVTAVALSRAQRYP